LPKQTIQAISTAYCKINIINISLKAKGVKKRIQTANAVKSVEIGEIEISGDNAERIAEILKRALE
jgi:translation initiation factor 1 (eIF-1/SUI1)